MSTMQLIKDQKLNMTNFKKIFNTLDWLRVPRKLNQDVTDYFYIGKYEDEEKIIKVKVRPDMHMAVEETLKNMTLDGKKPPKGAVSKKLCNWGASVEVLIDDSVLNRIKKIAKVIEAPTAQKVTWD